MSGDGKRPSDVLRRQLPELRKRLGDLSAQGVADRIAAAGGDMHRVVLSKIETGNRTVTLDDAFLLAAVLDVSPLHLFVPIEDAEEVQITPTLTVPATTARRWVRGQEPLPGMDERTFRTQVPLSEWEQQRQPSEREQEAFARLERARRQLRVAEQLRELRQVDFNQVQHLAGSGLPDYDRADRKLDEAIVAVAEAEVAVREAMEAYYAARGDDE